VRPSARPLELRGSGSETHGTAVRKCNTGLARFKDSPAILQNAHAYIANALWDLGVDLTDIKQYLRRS
jgi:hypothetical protein